MVVDNISDCNIGALINNKSFILYTKFIHINRHFLWWYWEFLAFEYLSNLLDNIFNGITW